MRFLARFAIIVIWLICIGILVSVFTNITNVVTLGWPSLLFYAVLLVAVAFGVAGISKHLWKIK